MIYREISSKKAGSNAGASAIKSQVKVLSSILQVSLIHFKKYFSRREGMFASFKILRARIIGSLSLLAQD